GTLRPGRGTIIPDNLPPNSMSRKHLHLVLFVAVVAQALLLADVRAARRDADLLKQKVATIQQLSASPTSHVRKTTVTETELNAYLALDAGSDLPAGVVDPSIAILGPGRVSGRAVVDLDAVR